ncbi:MAG: phosphoribosyltransferase family protein [Melioribacteraceae bacterium]|nr:phosphoribosyltransferase family protein [Melioribacteraceae bacterium]
MKWLNQFFDFYLPRFCVSCKSKLTFSESFLCNICFNKIEKPDPLRIEHEFKRKFEPEKLITEFASAFVFEKDKPLQHLIHSLKYEDNFNAGIYLGRKIGKLLLDKLTKWNPDLIIPVPLHRLKKAERGYNQSYFIAKGIKSVLNIPVDANIIKRHRFTNTQTELSLEKRKENIKHAFVIKKKKVVEGKNIIIIDDVITTGATISECAALLKLNGAADLFALSVAIAE